MRKKIEWGKEIIQAGSDAAEIARDAGIPGVGLLARFAQHFYDKHLQQRFERFVANAEIDEEFLSKVSLSEDYSNCFYAALETVRQTHSSVGVVALALIYKDHWDDPDFLIAAARAFAQISDKTIAAFISLYEEIAEGKNYLMLSTHRDGQNLFHTLYNEAVELIARNFFVLSTSASMHANGPIQGMKWTHTDAYYNYCKKATRIIGDRPPFN